MKGKLTLFFLIICVFLGFILPQSASATVYVDQSYCQECHKHATNRTHEKHEGYNVDCDQCHDGSPQSGNVLTLRCAECHPEEGYVKCSLVYDHNNADCLTCHFECTTPPGNHIDTCLGCHVVTDLHARLGHGDCTTCHNGTPQQGNVEVNTCSACHPLGAAGKCNLTNFHDPTIVGADCLTCHTECVGLYTSTTTTSLTYDHITNDCLTCHVVDTLHSGVGHGTCADCHNDIPEAGNVEPANCIICHPLGGPGSCNLIEGHDPGLGGDCISCHTECGGGPTTTTTSLTYNHFTADCLTCHVVDTLHAGLGHGTCSDCHNDAPGVGNVTPTNCVVCHPLLGPGSCNLIEGHDPGLGGDCLSCHTECGGGPTTTTTSLTYNHFADDCITCHVVDTLHASLGHRDCADCHNDAPGAGNVTPTNCILCHPLLGPGSCNLIEDHDPGLGGDCISCHNECGGGTSTTTTTQSFGHYAYNCDECHFPDDLHAGIGHTNCAVCHNGPPQTGNVEPANCMVCHLLGDPGECGLTVFHAYNIPGTVCMGCHAHSECRPTTTTTTIISTTTTVPTTTSTILTTTTTSISTTTTTAPTTTTTSLPTTSTTSISTTTTTVSAGDSDDDGIPDDIDNCPEIPNTGQEDFMPPGGNGIGDACECEGNFDCDEDCDGTDAATFKADFGRSEFSTPCVAGNHCNGDFDCDGDCDGTDAATFKSDFGRSSFGNPCPTCTVGEWCSYQN